MTPFARWVHAAGLVPQCLAALAVLSVAWIRRRKRPVQGL
jgi:apolipoprotein N-acyltransferase